jgi:type II secretory pathway pseudopilin PulG
MAMTRLPARRDRGFTYLSLIILVAIIGMVAAATLKMGSVIQRSRAEEQLLDIGAAFSDALQSYADATPAGLAPQPRTLNDLLRDPRFPGVRRHLRKIDVDPVTGNAEWGITYLGDKVGVLAVYSLSNAKPIKTGNFAPRFAGLEGKQKLSEWRFAASSQPAGMQAAPSPVVEKPPALAVETPPPVEVQQPAPAATETPPAEPQPAEPAPEEPTKV